MQRIYSLIVVLLLSGFFSNTYSEGLTINARIVKGKCKSLTIRYYCNIENYDSSGVWRKCYYDNCDSMIFDQKGNVIKSHNFEENWNIGRTEFEYDSLSNRISTKSYDSNGSLANHSKFKYKFDDNGHIIEEISDESFSNPGDSILNRMVNTGKSKYDKNGNKTELCLLIANGSISSNNVYKYNENNQLIEEILFLTGNIESQKEVYRYDIRGNRALQEHYNKGNLDWKINWIYDNRHRLIEVTEYEKKGNELKFVSRSAFKYDYKENIIAENTSNEKDELLSSVYYKYQYDQKENWTECVLYDSRNISGRKIVRKIEYY